MPPSPRRLAALTHTALAHANCAAHASLACRPLPHPHHPCHPRLAALPPSPTLPSPTPTAPSSPPLPVTIIHRLVHAGLSPSPCCPHPCGPRPRRPCRLRCPCPSPSPIAPLMHAHRPRPSLFLLESFY